MPLSEHEQRQLEAIERALYADDPKFANTVRFTDPRSRGRRRLALGVVLVLLGLGVVLGGVVSGKWYVGVIGFLIMLFGATRGYGWAKRLAGRGVAQPRPTDASQVMFNRAPHGGSRGRDRRRADRGRGSGRGGRQRRSRGGRSRGAGGFVERFEERWRRRFDQP